VAENVLSGLFKGLKLPRLMKMTFTYTIVLLAWVFFRANTMQDAMSVITKIFVEPGRLFIDQTTLVYSFIGLSLLLIKEAKDEFDIKISFSNSNNMVVRYAYYIAIISSIMLFGVFDSSQFIYFQF
jgi:alginate O-acetyltransferase complex protein AlgI